jgi:hypothetical protein
MPQNLCPEIQVLLSQFLDVFASKVEFPPEISCSHTIPLVPEARPVYIRSYRYTPLLKTEIENQVQEMLNAGLIQHSSSPFSSHVLLIKKKDSSYRFCIDYRHLNAITIKGQYPVPIIEEFLDELKGASWFSSMDLCAGFHQIPMHPNDCFKTAFQTHHGHYKFRVMSFGLTGTPRTFQKAMNSTLALLLSKCVLVFFDDILIYSQSLEDHVIHLGELPQLLRRDQWRVKMSKCTFATRAISYLGYVISSRGVSTYSDKISTVLNWLVPTGVKELNDFLGLVGYYRKFFKHFRMISRPLTDLLKKNVMFVWTSSHDTTFQTWKSALVQAPILALPDFSQPIYIETDACDYGVGAVLMQ